MKILLSTIVWCPENQPAREATILRHLQQLSIMKLADRNLDIHIVDNDVQSPALLAAMKEVGGTIERFSPQIGWARGRNLAMCRFLENQEYARLIMADCDQCWDDLTWTQHVLHLHKTEPELHAYMIRMDKWAKHATAKLKSGLVVDVYEEWLGTSNVCDRHVVETVGGLNTTDFPQDWGFHDCEWGRRLRQTGCLDSSRGFYIDPIRVNGSLHHDEVYDKSMEPLKLQCIRSYNQIFLQRERAILKNENLYVNPRHGLPTD